MPSVRQRALAAVNAPQQQPKFDYVVRAKVGPTGRSYATIGYGWNRSNGPGLSIKLFSLPIDKDWDGTLKILEPLEAEDADAEAPTQ